LAHQPNGTSSLRQRVGQTKLVVLALSRHAAVVALPSAPPLCSSFLAGCPRTPVLPVSAFSLSPAGCRHTYHLAERRRWSRGLSATAAQRLPPRSSAPSPLSAVQHLVRAVRVSCLSTQILNTYLFVNCAYSFLFNFECFNKYQYLFTINCILLCTIS